jgi:hypothetical protein
MAQRRGPDLSRLCRIDGYGTSRFVSAEKILGRLGLGSEEDALRRGPVACTCLDEAVRGSESGHLSSVERLTSHIRCDDYLAGALMRVVPTEKSAGEKDG